MLHKVKKLLMSAINITYNNACIHMNAQTYTYIDTYPHTIFDHFLHQGLPQLEFLKISSAVWFWIFINRFGFGLKPQFRFQFQNHYSTTFNKKYNQPLTCLHSANKPTSLQQSSKRHSRRAIKAN